MLEHANSCETKSFVDGNGRIDAAGDLARRFGGERGDDGIILLSSHVADAIHLDNSTGDESASCLSRGL